MKGRPGQVGGRSHVLPRPSATTLDMALRLSPAQVLFRRRAASRLTVVAYHGIDDPESFVRHLDHLRRAMRPVGLAEVLAALAGRRHLPPQAVLITFDDGERSVFDLGLPLLVERGLPAVAFVVAGLIDTDEPYWWSEVEWHLKAGGRVAGHPGASPADLIRDLKSVSDDVRQTALAELRFTSSHPPPPSPQLRRDDLRALEAAGVTVGNHSLTHRCLPRCADEIVRSEVSSAHSVLTAALGHEPEAFAYPNGDCDSRAREAVQQVGYAAAFLFDHRVNPRLPRDPLRISRVRVDSNTSLERFRILVSGLHPGLHHLRGRS